MKHDLAVLVLVMILGPAAIWASGWLPGLDAQPGAYLTLSLGVVAFFAFAVVPWLRRDLRGGAPARVAALVVTGVPFIVFGLLETPSEPGAWLVPAPIFFLVLAAGLLLAALPPRLARRLAAAALVLLALDAVLQTVERPLLPRSWVARGGPVLVIPPPGGRAEEPPDAVAGLWKGAPRVVDHTPLGEGEGPWLVPATVGSIEGEPPRVLLLDGQGDGPPTEAGGITFVPVGAGSVPPPLAWSGFDAALVLPGAWPEGAPEAAGLSTALARFVRGGGLLLGPGPDRAWPPGLARQLGWAAGATRSGLDGQRAYGLGTVLRVGSKQGILDLLEAGAWRPVLTTVFDRPGEALRRLESRMLDGGGPPPPDRRPQGVLLLAYALVIALLDQLLRGGGARVLGLSSPVLAVVAGLIWMAGASPPLRHEGVALDLGGGGGRRIEAVLLVAGERGWAGSVAWRGGGLVRRVGGRMDGEGQLRLAPGGRAWVLRERAARGGFQGEREDPTSAGVRAFVLGDLDPGRLRLGRIPALDLHLEGAGPVPARSLVWPTSTR